MVRALSSLSNDEIGEIKSLGVTSVEPRPIHTFTNYSLLRDKGLRNYWGYNSIGFFAPRSALRP
jgi:glycogen operon protein